MSNNALCIGSKRSGMLARIPLACALVIAAGTIPKSVNAQQSQWRLRGEKDDTRVNSLTDAMRGLISYSDCVVRRRYERARAFVLAPDDSPDQAKAKRGVLIRGGNEDGCLESDLHDARMRMTSAILAGGLAQALVRRDYPNLLALQPQLVSASAPASMTGSEAFGRCLVARDPAAAINLIRSMPGTTQESKQMAALMDDFGPCVTRGQQVTINRLHVRNVTAVAAYRMAVALRPQSNPPGAAK